MVVILSFGRAPCCRIVANVLVVALRGGEDDEIGELSKSPGARPKGIQGGAMRWRFGVDGPLNNSCATVPRLSSSLKDLRRLFAPRGGVCGGFGAGCAVLFFARNVVAPAVKAGLGRRVGVPRARSGDCDRFVERRFWSARHVV